MPGNTQQKKQQKRLFEQCVNQHAESMYRVAFRLTGCHDLAGELVQEAYLNAWKSLDSLKDDRKMRGWMFAILRNQFSKLLRKKDKAGQLTDENLESISGNDETAGEQQEQRETTESVLAALGTLDDNHRFPLLLVTMEGVSVDEAAEVLEIPRGTVLSRLHRGRQKLRDALERFQGGAGTRVGKDSGDQVDDVDDVNQMKGKIK